METDWLRIVITGIVVIAGYIWLLRWIYKKTSPTDQTGEEEDNE